jgi:hypothetical protein
VLLLTVASKMAASTSLYLAMTPPANLWKFSWTLMVPGKTQILAGEGMRPGESELAAAAAAAAAAASLLLVMLERPAL